MLDDVHLFLCLLLLCALLLVLQLLLLFRSLDISSLSRATNSRSVRVDRPGMFLGVPRTSSYDHGRGGGVARNKTENLEGKGGVNRL